MADRANLTSVEDLEAFRSSLVVYISKTRPALEEISSEAHRTRDWLEREQRIYWENQLRKRSRALEEAQQALFSSRMSRLRETSYSEEMALRKARRALDETQEKLRCVKRWIRDFDNTVDPLIKQMDRLLTIVTTDLPHAAAHLSQIIRTLQDYAGVKPAAPPTGAPPATDPEEPGKSTES